MADWTEPFSAACELASTVISDATVANAWAEQSALRGMTVGGVATHMYAAITRFEVAMDDAVASEQDTLDVAAFYGHNRVNRPEELDQGWHPRLREDAERRATGGHARVVRNFADLVTRLAERLDDEDPRSADTSVVGR